MSSSQQPSSNHIFILGGTGRVGQQVISNALSRNYHITALVRKPNSISPSHPNLTQISGSPQSSADILKALTSIPSTSITTNQPTRITIISTLGQTRTNSSNPWSTTTSPPMMMTDSIQALIDVLRSLTEPTSTIHISKLIILSMFGTGSSSRYMHWSLRWVMAHSNMRQTIEDHNGILDLIQQNFQSSSTSTSPSPSDSKLQIRIPYVLARPVMLKFGLDGPIPTIKKHGETDGEEGMGVTLGCDVRALVPFLVDQIDNDKFDWKMPVIST